MIHETADVEPGAQVGEGTDIWRWTHVRSTARIGSNCRIGSGVYIDADVSIGDNVKIENQAKLFLPATIGHGAFIGPGACLTNDRMPRAVNGDGTLKDSDDWAADAVVVEEGASIGAMATVLPGVSVGKWAMVGAGAIVTRDVAAHGLVLGSPARQIGWVCRCGERLDDEFGYACPCGLSYELVGEELVEDVG